MKIELRFPLSFNKVIQFLIISDFVLNSGWGLIGPIFAVFITQQVSGGDIRVVGFAASVYWIVKSLVQPFIAKYLDRNHGEIDDFYFLAAGLFAVSLIPLGYLFITKPFHLYILAVVQALAMACVVPTWAGIFTRHIDKQREAFEWSMESTAVGFAAGISGAIGGLAASVFGFKAVFVFVSAFTMLSVLMLFPIRPHIISKGGQLVRPTVEKPPLQ